LALWFPVWASAGNPLVSVEEAQTASHNTPLVRALLARDQIEAVRLIESGLPLESNFAGFAIKKPRSPFGICAASY
jgi:hypothetical protein